ncbi:hypothetical protein [Streptomyces sp. NPDC058964]|uniref:hypothetical protein n=1 Tax=Streptomyces sp. NPDC058964 TaxID=3346681 RepID=UPI00368F4BCB
MTTALRDQERMSGAVRRGAALPGREARRANTISPDGSRRSSVLLRPVESYANESDVQEFKVGAADAKAGTSRMLNNVKQ